MSCVLGVTLFPAIDDILMMFPDFRALMSFSASRLHSIVPVMLTASTRVQSSRSISDTSRNWPGIPELFTSTSIRPNSDIVLLDHFLDFVFFSNVRRYRQCLCDPSLRIFAATRARFSACSGMRSPRPPPPGQTPALSTPQSPHPLPSPGPSSLAVSQLSLPLPDHLVCV